MRDYFTGRMQWRNFKFCTPLLAENTIWAPDLGDVLGPSVKISFTQRQWAP